MEFSIKKATAALKGSGYRVTRQRRAVLEAIAGGDRSLTPATLYGEVRERYPDIGLVTVYRTLETLAGLGVLCVVHTEGRRSYVASRSDRHHHHIICSNCGTVVDFAECDLNRLEQKLARKTGFEIDGHMLEFTGRCSSCRKQAAGGVGV